MSLKRASNLNTQSNKFPRRLGVVASIVLIEGFEDWTVASQYGGTGSWTAVGSTGQGTSWGGQTSYVTQGSMGGTIANEYGGAFPSSYDTLLQRTINLTDYSVMTVDLQSTNMNGGGVVYVLINGVSVWSTGTAATYENTSFDVTSYGSVPVAFGAVIGGGGSIRTARLNFDNLRLLV